MVMLFHRQRRLLALLDALGGDVGHLDFQKLLFLYCREWEDTPSYEFVPYRFGGFSFTSYADKRRMIVQELLVDDEKSWKLAKEGLSAAAGAAAELKSKINLFVSRHGKKRGDALLVEVYKRHPYWATRSEVAERVLAGNPVELKKIAEARPGPGKPGVCTIGYEGRSLENYLNQLLRDGVTLLCDVRRNPLSRKYGFSKGTLSMGCEAVGIRYEHAPELGIDSKDRKNLKTQEDYDALFEVYERDSLPRQSKALERIRRWVEEGHRVALTCYEHLPQQCHRHCVAEALEREFGKGLAPTHL